MPVVWGTIEIETRVISCCSSHLDVLDKSEQIHLGLYIQGCVLMLERDFCYNENSDIHK